VKSWHWWALSIAALAIFNRKIIEGLMMNPKDALKNINVLAFLSTIARYESNGDYSILYGGGHFTDFSTHPNVHVPFHNPNKSGDGINDYSTAAGRYQINHPTWLLWRALPGAPSDFSPYSQDLLAVIGLQLKGALPDIIAGNFSAAMDKVSQTWASMPGSTAQQNSKTFDAVRITYLNNGGQIA